MAPRVVQPGVVVPGAQEPGCLVAAEQLADSADKLEPQLRKIAVPVGDPLGERRGWPGLRPPAMRLYTGQKLFYHNHASALGSGRSM